ncbi:phenylalanine--tRNA ligase subunit beta, partial [Microbacterium sp. zg.Y909]|uniref:phenylalanine--tRNA ligase subunit beta n=1 Tax=Microbacterium sp. zg.Y909 TaxID=2969413 RepID=UPI00214C5EDB
MRVPLSWLREYVDVPADATPEDVLAALVSVGFEEEDVHGFDLQGPIVVGQVVEFVEEPQSNGKTIRWCQVDVGEANGGVRGIVCGARNFFAGDKVVVTLPGAVLPGPFPIAARKTYGHVSDGMIASAKELGLGDEHNGILRLVELGLDPEVGADAIALLGLDDVAVEINVTPDRGYALSIRGVAREYSHATGAAFRDPGEREWGELQQPVEGFAVAVDDQAPIRGRVGASEFVVRIVRDVDPTKPTPPWMVARLTLAGIRSLGILIDITNYVMLELGNPIHGYDLDRLTGGITVRRAHEGEKLTTLDGKERALSTEDLLITDESGPIGLAGVMGGGTTEMTDATRNVLIEAAVFDTVSIARTARRHKLPSEASRRFERGVDPLIPFVAARRVADLMVEYAG